jgi:hypothetical protein
VLPRPGRPLSPGGPGSAGLGVIRTVCGWLRCWPDPPAVMSFIPDGAGTASYGRRGRGLLFHRGSWVAIDGSLGLTASRVVQW